MVIDSSALVAILRKEPEAARFTRAILRDSVRLISAANLLEAGIAIDNQAGLSAGRRLDAFVERAGIGIEPVTEAQVRIARQAYIDFGRGNHPARSISATASPMRWPRLPASRCCSRATTSDRRISDRTDLRAADRLALGCS